MGAALCNHDTDAMICLPEDMRYLTCSTASLVSLTFRHEADAVGHPLIATAQRDQAEPIHSCLMTQ
jgi:hypothetical protein